MGLFNRSSGDTPRPHIPGVPVGKINLRIIPADPKLVRTPAARHEHHAPVPLSHRPASFAQPVVSQTPVVPRPTLPGVPLPTCAVSNTPAAIKETTADATAGVLVKKPPVTQADMDVLAVGDTVVSNNGTTREIMAIDGDKFTFRRTKRITGVELKYFATQPAEGEEKGDEVDFSTMTQGGHVYNGGIEYTIKGILKTGEGVVSEVVLSHTETKENYRAQGYDHIDRIDKRRIFPKLIHSNVPLASTDTPTG